MSRKLTSKSRNKLTHRFLYYLHHNTSEKYPQWRNETIRFLFELFELMEENSSINAVILRADGLYLYHESTPIVFMHFRNKHFLLHTTDGYKLYQHGDALFPTRHQGSWPKMWKITTSDDCTALLNFLRTLPKTKFDDVKHSRTIPQWVKELVYERDGGRCVACGSKKDIHFDHILPFSMGGSSVMPENIQLLCAQCNSEKAASFKK